MDIHCHRHSSSPRSSRLNYRALLLVFLLILGTLGLLTYSATLKMPDTLEALLHNQQKSYYFDRYGERLNITYANSFNSADLISLHEVPSLLTKALIFSEDRRFYEHDGVDWRARAAALLQNIRAAKMVRGASSITEQVVRIIHPRRRSLQAKWLEGFEAYALQQKFSKAEILDFYINQVPYAKQRRGIKQASQLYFGRDIDTLNEKEMLALVVLIRAPHHFDPFRHPQRLEGRIISLADKMYRSGQLTQETLYSIKRSTLGLGAPKEIIDARHFINYVATHLKTKASDKIQTTLDGHLQIEIQKNLDTTLEKLSSKRVQNGAVLVIDHQRNEVVAWVVGFAGEADRQGHSYDPVVQPRQPGSTLKPFLYAQAFEKGYEASTLLDDSELREGVGLGSHTYKNYSNLHYGEISVRESLGNSLNIPAVRTLQYVGTADFLKFLKRFGINTLQEHPDYYGDGLALGNSEVTLLELTQAYATLARMGNRKALSFLENRYLQKEEHQVIDEKVASLIADILSDPFARAKEFGFNSILNMPTQTAVKTGTSNDYHDAWVFGYNDKYTVGIWFGNLDYQKMDEITGSKGPARVLRTTLSLLNRHRETHPLYLSDDLVRARDVNGRDEYYLRTPTGTQPQQQKEFKIIQPSKNLIMAKDPRIPDNLESYIFKVENGSHFKQYTWRLNDQIIATTSEPQLEWFIERGSFLLEVNGARVRFSVQ